MAFSKDLFFLKKKEKKSWDTIKQPIKKYFSITKTKENLSEGVHNITDFFEA